MYPWQPQQQASHYPPAPPQQAAVGAFYWPWAQVNTGIYPHNFPRPQPRPQQQIVCSICRTRIDWGEPQCHFPPWNAKDGVESVGGDGNGNDGTILPAITLHLQCGKSRALGGSNLHLVAAATIKTRYGKSYPAYRKPTDAIKVAIRRSRRCLLEFNGFETPTLYHLEGELVPLVEEELAKWRAGSKGKKKDAADNGGGVDAAPLSKEKRRKEEKVAKIDNEAVDVLAAIAAEEGEEEECRARGDGGDASCPKGGREQSKPTPSKKAKHHSEQSKSPSSAAAAAKARKRKQTSFLWEEQAKEWDKPKNRKKAKGARRLHERIIEVHEKYVCTINTLDRLKRRNAELQARMGTGMVALPRSQRETLIAYARAAIDSDRGGEVRRAIERFRDEEISFMNVSMDDVVGSICDSGVEEEVEENSAGKQDAGKGGSTDVDEGNANDDANTEERSRSEEDAKKDANRSGEEEEAKEDRQTREDINRSEMATKEKNDLVTTEPKAKEGKKAGEDVHCSETGAKEEIDLVRKEPDERKEERIIFI